jgi:hypothetical protein
MKIMDVVAGQLTGLANTFFSIPIRKVCAKKEMKTIHLLTVWKYE